MKKILLLGILVALVGCSSPKHPLSQQRPKGILRMERQSIVSELIETNGMKRLVTVMDDVHGLGLDTVTFAPGSILQPTGIIGLPSVALPEIMTINASNLVGTIVASYNGTAYGATELYGWTVLGGPAGYVAKLDKASKTIRLVDPNSLSVIENHNRMPIKDQRIRMRR